MKWVIVRPGGLKSETPTGKGVLTEDTTSKKLNYIRSSMIVSNIRIEPYLHCIFSLLMAHHCYV